MGLDVYAGPVTRYVAGDWLTVVQQAGEAAGLPVQIVRANEQQNVVTDIDAISNAVQAWQTGLLKSLNVVGEDWSEGPEIPYSTDKPDWDGYGAVVLLAAYDEQPQLAPGTSKRQGLRKRTIGPDMPREFGDAQAFKVASASPSKYPTLLQGAEWCLPIRSGSTVFQAPTPNGTPLRMGRVDKLVEELTLLNSRTLRLGPRDFSDARKAGPPASDAPMEDVVPFGLSVMIGLAEYAAANSVAWIMDY